MTGCRLTGEHVRASRTGTNRNESGLIGAHGREDAAPGARRLFFKGLVIWIEFFHPGSSGGHFARSLLPPCATPRVSASRIEHSRSARPGPGQDSISTSSTAFIRAKVAILRFTSSSFVRACARTSPQSASGSTCRESSSFISFRENPISCAWRMKRTRATVSTEYERNLRPKAGRRGCSRSPLRS